MEEDNYYRPDGAIPPQLTREQMLAMDDQQRVDANRLGQFQVLKSGRAPLPFEAAGERFATADEIRDAARKAGR
ncbi:MAG: hypothetical protein R2720_00950 [Candidatus Nanopelagicales bacterium]